MAVNDVCHPAPWSPVTTTPFGHSNAEFARVASMLGKQSDVTVVEVEDYIADLKPNGDKGLHGAVEKPVFLSDRVQQVSVEAQIRTIAMDLWARFEHEIVYKNHGARLATVTEPSKANTRHWKLLGDRRFADDATRT